MPEAPDADARSAHAGSADARTANAHSNAETDTSTHTSADAAAHAADAAAAADAGAEGVPYAAAGPGYGRLVRQELQHGGAILPDHVLQVRRGIFRGCLLVVDPFGEGYLYYIHVHNLTAGV
jgi:hypothetical protein